MTLFVKQDFISHSGIPLHWKIECDALSDEEIDCLAFMLTEVLPPFGQVVGIPRGGLRLESALKPYVTEGRPLIVDDVLTTGRSMIEMRDMSLHRNPIGAVLFSRGPCPDWITPLFRMPVR
jgi:hypothetical protein